MKTRKKPYWNNVCDHPEESYVDSFEYYPSVKRRICYDVYAYQSPHLESSTAVCLRYGRDANEYESYCCLSYLPNTELGRTIWKLLLENGKITWTKTKKEN